MKTYYFDGLLMWWAGLTGPIIPPGKYNIKLSSGEEIDSADFDILLDPRTEGNLEDRAAQFEFLLGIRNKVDETHAARQRV